MSGHVLLSLRRSKARAQVLTFLVRRGPAYASMIADGTGLHADTVLGAIRGASDRYRPELSLLSLGLVREVDLNGHHASDRVQFYDITDQGRRVGRALMEGELGVASPA